MTISHSESRQFHSCQRKWFFRKVFARWNAKDPRRREAFILSKLQSLSAWRGSLVDSVISQFVLPRLQASLPTVESILAIAKTRFDQQVQFALGHRVRVAGMSVSKHPDVFAAWYDIEYESAPGQHVLDAAWSEVESALRNALSMDTLFADLRQRRLYTQPRLFYELGGLKISANPDVLAFGRDRTIRIVDWKVHSFGLKAAKQQLSVYAAVIHRGAPTYTFPYDPRHCDIAAIQLTEAQLLKNECHDYGVSDDELDEILDDIFSTAQSMHLARGDDEVGWDDREEYPATPWVEQCNRCSFKKLCREGAAK